MAEWPLTFPRRTRAVCQVMNVNLPLAKRRAFYGSIDTGGEGAIDFAKFAAGILGAHTGVRRDLQLQSLWRTPTAAVS